MSKVWLHPEDARLADLLTVLKEEADPADYPYAERIEQQVPQYDAARIRTEDPRAVQAEFATALGEGPGIIVLKGAFGNEVVDAATDEFAGMIADQHKAGTAAGDHFAKPGANDRVWNALEKLAIRAPEVFAAYYSNDLLALVAKAWLGPAYQVTSQVNVVNPGGEGQTVHRDYHLGFQSNEVAALYPAHVHRLSSVLTLQGAVAHCDMPVESGPTLYLPHSHKYELGYLAWRQPEFGEHFVANHVQLPLEQGDAVFFNPALFHAAGSNHSHAIKRMANLLQISSAFGRAMESVDRVRMAVRLYPVLRAFGQDDAFDLDNVIAATAEGYAFPTNLDRDQPIGGLAPQTQADLLRQALDEDWPADRLEHALDQHAVRRRTADI
ncbi:ectoine hydroxylase-related dioxygenase (phytanoyl-CoA dioxygenase family) [Kribbella sp. VKM Ac-2527]|uniref:Ectoine hydroxylase-related dioxygenase (Phytanoyl-CoA dioxygenase family) n=1 Tax=Kribbella caucasensis TaxID=2512215 RepID=A0A4R6KJG6_9ACTN|nr:phytanoyl-CoA dioxygenase family protein [Kribbella sp. VKM Ac-2527]TDO51444.1 ectoine hydroxylase-related dioxygenase (phytanoyl-CoA dioxygenase family) [Kribbella sp. VKM Ac-2527]